MLREAQQGSSLRVAAELLTFTALSHSLFVAWAVFQKSCDDPDLYIRSGGIGLSAVAIALQVRVVRHEGTPMNAPASLGSHDLAAVACF